MAKWRFSCRPGLAHIKPMRNGIEKIANHIPNWGRPRKMNWMICGMCHLGLAGHLGFLLHCWFSIFTTKEQDFMRSLMRLFFTSSSIYGTTLLLLLFLIHDFLLLFRSKTLLLILFCLIKSLSSHVGSPQWRSIHILLLIFLCNSLSKQIC